ncbi:MAG: hypothetical protein NTU73_10330, partial [Ignavibacteriae bacterium]|nr:hypothetical protein [Ignavibacteriota bacterium]
RNDKIVESVRNFLSDKLNELEEFIKNKKIFKMELTKLSNITSDFDELEEHDNEPKDEEEKPVKRVFIGGSKPDKSSFDDSFEVK